MKRETSGEITQFMNCSILRNHEIIFEDFWIRNGKIINPEQLFFDEKIKATKQIDCNGALICPGFIDIQINGGFGVDFSQNESVTDGDVEKVAKGILAHGVTSFCPTIVTSPPEIYKKVLAVINKKEGGKHGATILGVHLEGPFINPEKKGAHPPSCIRNFSKSSLYSVPSEATLFCLKLFLMLVGDCCEGGVLTVEMSHRVMGPGPSLQSAQIRFHLSPALQPLQFEEVVLVTLAPEIEGATEVIESLVKKGVVVSLGHSQSNLEQAEKAFKHGASLITHLFNAMLPFHHRDPGLVGLLASNVVQNDRTVFFGIIADGVHTHPAALRIAHRIHPKGLVLVTDAISALGFEEGNHTIGQKCVEIKNGRAFISGTDTLCGSIATMNFSVKYFKEATGCSVVEALEAATLHPALALNISEKKGTLNFGSDADFIMLTKGLEVLSTWIAGECVYQSEERN